MTFETFEAQALDSQALNIAERIDFLRRSFQSSIKPEHGAFSAAPDSIDNNIRNWIELDTTDTAIEVGAIRSSFFDTAKEMYDGRLLENGKTGLGLKQIHDWKVNPDYYKQNMKQHSGYAAEVIGTAKENLKAKLEGSELTTCRADDRPDLYKRNDQYVDKVRVNSAGEVVERVQVKFVGKNAAECLSKLASKKYDKYFSDGLVDKMEVPKDYYDGMKKLIPDKIKKLENQLERVRENGNAEAVKDIETQIDRYKKIDEMLEKSTVSSDEAMEATKHPKRYTAKLFAENAFAKAHKAGMESAAFAATITAAVSTVDNVSKVMEGEITAQEAFVDVAKDTGAAGGLAYGTAFVSTAVAQTMSESSHQLLKSLGGSNVPAAVISFGVQSFDSVTDYATGVIDGQQLAYDLGENAVQISGSIAGAALAGAALGSVVPGAGTVAGFAVGMVGGMVGCAVASEAYVTAVEFGAEHADALADKAKEMANKTVDIAREAVPDKVGSIVSSINDFASSCKLPFRL